jgi:flagellar basal-body rod protein FlgB
MASVIDRLFNSSFGGLEKTLDLTWQRNQALASNISNAETPQYRAVDMTFANELKKAFGEERAELFTTSSKHLDIGEASNAHTVPDLSGATKPDGNNVDIDLQMGKLAANSGDFMNAARLYRKQLGFIRNAIRNSER